MISLLGRAIVEQTTLGGAIVQPAVLPGHEYQGPRAGRLVHDVLTMGLGMFFSAQSRKTSNCAKAVDPSMPICVWPLNLPSKRWSSALITSAGPTLRVGLAFMAATAA